MWWLLGGWGISAAVGAVLVLVERSKRLAAAARHAEAMRHAERLVSGSRHDADTWQRTALDLERASWSWGTERKRLERVIADKDRHIEELSDELPRLLSTMDPAASAAAVGAHLDRVLAVSARRVAAPRGAGGGGGAAVPAISASTRPGAPSGER